MDTDDQTMSDPCTENVATCTESQNKVILQAFKDASAMLARAEEPMIKYINKPSAGKVARALKKHFKWTEAIRQQAPKDVKDFPDVPANVLKVIRNLLTKISHPFGAICSPDQQLREAVNARFPRELRHILAAALQDDTNCFMYTPDYFKKKAVDRAKTVIHEMCHSWAHMGADGSYEDDPAYPVSIRSASENPDSYACLIRDIGSG
jgi:hypothetical protein